MFKLEEILLKADNNFSFYISAPSGYNTNYLDCKKVDGTFEFILTNNIK